MVEEEANFLRSDCAKIHGGKGEKEEVGKGGGGRGRVGN